MSRAGELCEGTALKFVGKKDSDAAVRLYCQSGPAWIETEVRGWWKDRLFIKIPDEFCYGGNIVELDRRELWSKRCANHDGYTYFTPDGREKEDAVNARTITAGQIKEAQHLYYYSHTEIRDKWIAGWHTIRIFNANSRWIFAKWEGCDEIEWIERKGLEDARGAFAHPTGNTFYNEVGRRAKIRHDEELVREHALRRERVNRPWILSEDAITLGVSINANEAEIIAAFKRLAKIHHPDAGGTVEGFQKISEAKDRAMITLKKRKAA